MSSTPTKVCSSCKSEIHSEAKKCPHCHAALGTWFWRHPIATALLVLFVGLPLAISVLSNAASPNTPSTTATSTATDVKANPQTFKEALRKEIENTKSFDGDAMRKKRANGEESPALSIFETWGALVVDGKKSTDKETVDLAKDLEKRASAIQIKEFPLMRKVTAERLKQVLWSQDIEVSFSGPKNNVLEFVGVVFARNQNIADIYGPASGNLKRLRFTDIKFRWANGADGSRFTHTDDKGFPKDGDVVGRFVAE